MRLKFVGEVHFLMLYSFQFLAADPNTWFI